ncbi:MAG: type VI secretion system tip protein VgrG [Polyangiaceae bacterium]|nr:type VI secretion system tip protein VgrG [Polyangiaceae bacterium]
MALAFSLESVALPPTARVIGFRGTEALTRPYVFEIYVSVEGPVEVEPAVAVGRPATLTIRDQASLSSIVKGDLPVTYSGIFGRFQMVRATATSTLYRAMLVPRLWQLSLTKHSRMFTKMSIPDVLKAVLSQEGISDFEFRVGGSYSPEEHVCQYRESSLDFIHRWMEREGLYYYFDQTGGSERLVVVDSMSAHEPNVHGPVRYHPAEGDASAGRHFDNFVTGAMSLPAMVRVTDYDYAKPSLAVTGASPVWPGGVGEWSESSSDARVFTPGDGARIAQVRAEALRAEGGQVSATGSALGLSPGYLFELEHHPRAGLDKPYLVTRQKIIGQVTELARSWGRLAELEARDQVLSVDITAVSADLQYREPQRTNWPRVDGYEGGVVDGPADSDYAQLDEQGRYAVKFKFDEGSLAGGKASTWVRMMQPHAGAVEGWHFPLRKGTEVVFLFLGGDPDRPVIAGAIPNAVTPSPVTNGNHTRNVIQTGGRNRLEFEDQAGQQRITLSTPHQNTYLRMGAPNDDHELIAKTDGRGFWNTGGDTDTDIGGNWVVTVDSSLNEKVSGMVIEDYGSSKKETVSGLVDETYDSHMNQVSGSSQRRVGGSTQDTLTGPWTVTNNAATTHNYLSSYTNHIAGPHQETIAGPQQSVIGATQMVTIGGTQTITIGAGQNILVGGSKAETIGGSVKVTAGGTFDINATGDITIKSAGKVNVDQSQWIEFCKGDKKANIGGIVDDYILGMKTSFVGGIYTDISAGAKLFGHFGPERELSPNIDKTAAIISNKAADFQIYALACNVNAGVIKFITPLFQSSSALTII